jgi:hypothetical protein
VAVTRDFWGSKGLYGKNSSHVQLPDIMRTMAETSDLEAYAEVGKGNKKGLTFWQEFLKC